MPKLTVLVGPPGSGKSTLASKILLNNLDKDLLTFYVSQDEQGKGHLAFFNSRLEFRDNIVLDRMNFDKKQRERYLAPAKALGYETEIIVLHENKETCLKRCIARIGQHDTIKDELDAHKAINFFFSHYERVTDDEADVVTRIWPDLSMSLPAIWVDIDNTLSDSNHRQHFLDTSGRKNWTGFFEAMGEDPVNEWCKRIVTSMRPNTIICICSGRPDNYRDVTVKWLRDNSIPYDYVFMRPRQDSRPDYIVKEIMLEFEIKTRVHLLFSLDDRKQVIDRIREHGVIVLDCAGEKGNF